jgi:glycosyltransferase involved in cell wall biosynthesis
VDPRDYEGRLDPGLASLVPPDLRVVRCRAWPARWTRRIGVGDLGVRAFDGLRRACADLLRRERFDALFITIYPTYPALLGPILKRRFGVPFVLDYQDPWVGAWGEAVGAGPNGRPDLKSRLTRALARRLEPRAVRAADAITTVSGSTCAALRRRYPALDTMECAVIPVGGEPADFDRLRREPRPNPYFDAADGAIHLCYVGTLLPLGFEVLRALLCAVRELRQRCPERYEGLHLHFFGTSNQTRPDAAARVLPVARELGVADRVSEIAPRIDYLDALTVQVQATAILLLGSSESHYTASKLYPALLSGVPILAIHHAESSVVEILRRAARPSMARVIAYTDAERAESRVDAIYGELSALIDQAVDGRAAAGGEASGYGGSGDGRAAAGGEASGYGGPGDGRAAAGGEASGYGGPNERERAATRFEEFSAAALAGRLAATLEHVRERTPRSAAAGR